MNDLKLSQTHAQVVILDYGSQYALLILKLVRKLRVSAVFLSYRTKAEEIKTFNPKCIILSGGPENATNGPKLDKALLSLNIPILGICYGFQIISIFFNAKLIPNKYAQFGAADISKNADDILFSDFDWTKNNVWMSHSDSLTSTAKTPLKTITTSNNIVACFVHEKLPIYGLQFHPEVNHTSQGELLIKNFIFKISNCQHDWTPEKMSNEILASLEQNYKNKKTILALSGGVDSLVTAVLLKKVIGNNLTCIMVDNGLLREQQFKNAQITFKKKYGLNIISINAKSLFLQKLKGVSDPEKKRKIIGKLFIDVFYQQTKHLKNVTHFAQGTIYSDVIESSNAEHAKLIKSHHNVGGLPKTLKLKLIEPFRWCLKHEVRAIGKTLGISHEDLYQHPIPGPGLAIRIIGSVSKFQIKILQQADAILINYLKQHNLYDKMAQAFCVLLPIRSVGVVGDKRRYGYVCAIRCVDTIDFMTANPNKILSIEQLTQIATQIINYVPQIGRVVYDVTTKPPSTIEWE